MTGADVPPPAGAPVLLLCGASAAGASSVAAEIFDQIWRTGIRAARIDLDEVGRYHSAPGPDDAVDHRARARALAALWRGFTDDGARCLVTSGTVSDRAAAAAYRSELAGTELTVVWLRVEGDGMAEPDGAAPADVDVGVEGLDVPTVARLVLQRASGWPGLPV